MTVIYEHFSNLHQLIQTITNRPNNEVMKNEFSSQTGSEEFTLTTSWDHAVQLLQSGYTDILGEIKKGMTKHAKCKDVANRRMVTTAVQGVTPHIPNAIVGLPNSMIHYENKQRKTKAISIVYVLSAASRVEAKDLFQSGIALLSLIHALELRRYRIALKVMFFGAEKENEQAIGTVTIKQYQQHLDLHKLCFPIAHPSMLRRIGFKWLETVPGLSHPDFRSGYGRPIPLEELSAIHGIKQKNEHFINWETLKECNYDIDQAIHFLQLH